MAWVEAGRPHASRESRRSSASAPRPDVRFILIQKDVAAVTATITLSPAAVTATVGASVGDAAISSATTLSAAGPCVLDAVNITLDNYYTPGITDTTAATVSSLVFTVSPVILHLLLLFSLSPAINSVPVSLILCLLVTDSWCVCRNITSRTHNERNVITCISFEGLGSLSTSKKSGGRRRSASSLASHGPTPPRPQRLS